VIEGKDYRWVLPTFFVDADKPRPEMRCNPAPIQEGKIDLSNYFVWQGGLTQDEFMEEEVFHFNLVSYSFTIFLKGNVN
jgi:hypothetical protein